MNIEERLEELSLADRQAQRCIERQDYEGAAMWIRAMWSALDAMNLEIVSRQMHRRAARN